MYVYLLYITNKTERFSLKSRCVIDGEAFKARLTYSVDDLLNCQVSLSLKFECICITIVMSPCSYDFLKVQLYVIITYMDM